MVESVCALQPPGGHGAQETEPSGYGVHYISTGTPGLRANGLGTTGGGGVKEAVMIASFSSAFV